jgi:hypothetical protein
MCDSDVTGRHTRCDDVIVIATLFTVGSLRYPSSAALDINWCAEISTPAFFPPPSSQGSHYLL